MQQQAAQAGFLFDEAAAWAAWLTRHHASEPQAWLRLAKKMAGCASVSYAEALDVALCFGWIDGQKKALDADFWLQKFTPRKPRSIWSRINREKALALIAQGRMQAAGLLFRSNARRPMAAGRRLTSQPARRRFRLIFRLRWIATPRPGNSLPRSAGRTVTRFFFGSTPPGERRHVRSGYRP